MKGSSMFFDASLLVGLILMNGVFAMAELAIDSSRRARLMHLAEEDMPGRRAPWPCRATPRDFCQPFRSRASEARWRAVIDSAVDGIIVIDQHGRVEAFNPAATRLFGYEEEEVLGRNVDMLMPSPYREEHSLLHHIVARVRTRASNSKAADRGA